MIACLGLIAASAVCAADYDVVIRGGTVYGATDAIGQTSINYLYILVIKI